MLSSPLRYRSYNVAEPGAPPRLDCQSVFRGSIAAISLALAPFFFRRYTLLRAPCKAFPMASSRLLRFRLATARPFLPCARLSSRRALFLMSALRFHILAPAQAIKKGWLAPTPYTSPALDYRTSRNLKRRPFAVVVSRHTTVSGSGQPSGSPNMLMMFIAERITPFEEDTYAVPALSTR